MDANSKLIGTAIFALSVLFIVSAVCFVDADADYDQSNSPVIYLEVDVNDYSVEAYENGSPVDDVEILKKYGIKTFNPYRLEIDTYAQQKPEIWLDIKTSGGYFSTNTYSVLINDNSMPDSGFTNPEDQTVYFGYIMAPDCRIEMDGDDTSILNLSGYTFYKGKSDGSDEYYSKIKEFGKVILNSDYTTKGVEINSTRVYMNKERLEEYGSYPAFGSVYFEAINTIEFTLKNYGKNAIDGDVVCEGALGGDDVYLLSFVAVSDLKISVDNKLEEMHPVSPGVSHLNSGIAASNIAFKKVDAASISVVGDSSGSGISPCKLTWADSLNGVRGESIKISQCSNIGINVASTNGNPVTGILAAVGEEGMGKYLPGKVDIKDTNVSVSLSTACSPSEGKPCKGLIVAQADAISDAVYCGKISIDGELSGTNVVYYKQTEETDEDEVDIQFVPKAQFQSGVNAITGDMISITSGTAPTPGPTPVPTPSESKDYTQLAVMIGILVVVVVLSLLAVMMVRRK